MIQYNYAAEIAALIIIVILVLNLFSEKELDSRRNRFFKGIVCAVFVLVVVTILSTYMTINVTEFPLWLIMLMMDLYYMSLPFALVMGLLYVRSLKKNKHLKGNLSISTLLLLLPYVFYFVFIISNHITHGLFSISVQNGYIRGPLYQLPYPIVLFYVGAIIYFAIKNRNTTNKGISFVLCANVIAMAGIAFVQLYFSELLLSGLANVAGVLVVYLYVQNVTKATDSLTGLSNRLRLAYDVEKKVRAFSRKRCSTDTQNAFSLVLYSLRNIKGVNERYGLFGGDQLLEAVAKHLRSVFTGHHVYRYAGDEFAVLIEGKAKNIDELIHIAAERFDRPFLGEENTIEMSVNVVYARVDFPEFGQDAQSLVSALDYSISSLKHGKYRTNYMHDLSVCEKMSRRNSVIERIKYALDNDGFEMYYQPIYSTKDKTFMGAEALIRMKKEVGAIYPNEFIPLAEETGLIVTLTYMVLDKICMDLRMLMNRYGSKLEGHSISINFPYAQFLENDLVSKVMIILEMYNISPKQIKIEITERTLIGDAGLITGIMREMQEKGIMFEVDDFGVDYSNISMLLNLPVEIIKIDRSLVLLASEKQEHEEFFKLLLQAIRHTGRKVVIEGVETKEQVDFFTKCGSEYIQGFFYSHPMPLSDCFIFLDENL